MRDLPRDALILLLGGYKRLLSPLYPGACRYLPSCSEYAAIAIREHGAMKGAWLALTRLSRCHPYGGSGLDPVPVRRSRQGTDLSSRTELSTGTGTGLNGT